MKFTVNKTTLLVALNTASKALGKGAIPVLDNFLFAINDQILTVSASNLETFLSTSITVDADFNKSFIVPSTRIMGLIKELPEGTISFTLEERAGDKGKIFYNLTIKAGKGKYTIPCEPGENFPEFKNSEKDAVTTVQIGARDLISAIDKTLFATDKGIENPKMAGLNLLFDGHGITFAGCDRFVLSAIRLTDSGGFDGAKSIIIPNKSLGILQSLEIQNEDVVVIIGERNITFDLGGETVLKSILVDDKYPDYKGIIPVNNSRLLKVNRADLIGSVKRVNQFADATNSAIKLTLSAAELMLNSQNDYGEDAVETVDCELTGETLEIWLNCKQMLSILTRMLGDMAYMHLSEPNRPVLFKSDDSSVESKTDLMLAMPVMGVN